MGCIENGQTVEIFRDVNTARLAELTGGAASVSADATVALWMDGGVSISVENGKTRWAWRGILQLAGHIIPDSAVLFDSNAIRVVFPTGEHDPIQGFTIREGRIRGFETFPASTDPLRQAATYARDKFLARQEALPGQPA